MSTYARRLSIIAGIVFLSLIPAFITTRPPVLPETDSDYLRRESVDSTESVYEFGDNTVKVFSKEATIAIHQGE